MMDLPAPGAPEGSRMPDVDRLSRLEDAVIDLAILVSEGRWERLSVHMAPEVVEAGKRLQAFQKTVGNERAV